MPDWMKLVYVLAVKQDIDARRIIMDRYGKPLFCPLGSSIPPGYVFLQTFIDVKAGKESKWFA